MSFEITFPSLLVLSGGGGDCGGSGPSGGVDGVPPGVLGAIGGEGAMIT
ncbi:MAG: hypothetical protein WBV84_08345 [Nitrososphaeraceae archaeon]